jgi:serine/threonine-protein kinase
MVAKGDAMQLGQVISGKYRLLRLIGDGGMGAVYEAHHEVLGARVAIKVLHEDLARRPELVDRFLREARVLAQINSPHVVRVLDIALAEGTNAAYIVMELLTGEALAEVIARVRRLPVPVAVDYASQVLEALAAAHALGVVHRDLKPENVIVTRDGERDVLKVIDFGIAKAGSLGGASANLTVSGTLMGTPEYMAPEQAFSADKADARSDIFAVGVLLYEMLSGARPVDGDEPTVVALKVQRGDVRPLIHRMPDLPRDLAGLVHRAMAPRPELRFASAVEMRQALEAVMAGRRVAMLSAAMPIPALTPPPSPAQPPGPAPEHARGTGTMFGAPVNAAGPMPGPAPVWPVPAPVGGIGTTAPAVFAPAPPMRGRGRQAGLLVWLMGGVAVLTVGGIGVAVVFSRSNDSFSPSTQDSPARPPPDPASTATAPAAVVTSDPGLAPLPTTPSATHPTHAAVSPPPHSSASGAPAGSASAAPVATATPPFGVPPFAFPSSFPNPFPMPASSGVGPVFTVPTAFPPFGLPPQQQPQPGPAPSGQHKGGH